MSADTIRRLKQIIAPLRRTPMHPQWLCSRHDAQLVSWIRAVDSGSTVLDVGCASQWPRALLRQGCTYYGLDHPATAGWYGARPALYADAHALPVRSGSVNVLLALDVLEHLRDPEQALREINRVLAADGQLILQVPFLYPIHDAPHDHTRWTGHGHASLAARAGFRVQQHHSLGEALETAGLLANLALCQAAIAGLQRLRPSALLLVLLPILLPMINLSAWLLARLAPRSDFMPFSYRGIWTKVASLP